MSLDGPRLPGAALVAILVPMRHEEAVAGKTPGRLPDLFGLNWVKPRHQGARLAPGPEAVLR